MFSDLPSQHELTELKTLKSRTAMLLIVSVFLAGGFVASALGIGYFLQADYPKQIATLKTEHETQLAQLRTELDQERAARIADRERTAPYAGISEDRERVAELRQRIDRMLQGEKQGAQNDRRVQALLAAAYLNGDAWSTVERSAREQLSQEITALERAERAVRDWVAPPRPAQRGASPFQ